jgi:hypothetical protein
MIEARLYKVLKKRVNDIPEPKIAIISVLFATEVNQIIDKRERLEITN